MGSFAVRTYIHMNTPRLLFCVAFTALTIGCSDRDVAKKRAREEAEAKARAEAARKEMQQLPKTFRSFYNKKLEPSDSVPSEKEKKEPSPPKT